MTLLRMALAQYKALDDDYYGSNMGIWEMPTEDPLNFSNVHRFILLGNNQPQSVRTEIELRVENRTEETRNAAIETAQGIQHVARKFGLLTVDATAETIKHTKHEGQLDAANMNDHREARRVVATDLALYKIPSIDDWN